MGRPPTHGAPSFRFFAAEVAQMETLLREHGGHVPPREMLMALANKFSNSVERSGKIAVQMKQVWNWFQNRRYALRSKLVKPPGSSNLPPNPRDEATQVRNVPSVPQQTHLPSGSNMIRNTSESPLMEFEAKSARDGAWYDVQAFLSHRYLETGNPEVLVRFSGFGPEEDEWVNVRKYVRQRSLPCESSECIVVLPGDLILCFQEGKEQALYFDAHVLDAQRRRHDLRGCRCRFLVRYDHDYSEEIVPLRKVCRRPETDYRLQQLHAANEPASASASTSVSAESRKPVADPNLTSTARVTNPNPSAAVTVPPTITNVSAQTLISAPTPSSTLASASSSTIISSAIPSPALISTPSSTLSSATAPSPSLISTPSSTPISATAPSPSLSSYSAPTPSRSLISAPSPSPSSTSISAPTASPILISAPSLSSTPSSAPTPSQTLISAPSTSPTSISAPTPSPTLISAPSLSSTPSSAPTPSQTLISAPSPSPTSISAPTPSPTLISAPSLSSTPSSAPTPSVTLISAQSLTPIPGPSPSPALISAPSSSLTQNSDASPSLTLISAPSSTPMIAPSTSSTPISAPSPTPSAPSVTPVLAPSTSPTPISAPSTISGPTSSPTSTPIFPSTQGPALASAPSVVPTPSTPAPMPISFSTPVATPEVKKLESDNIETSTREASARVINTGATSTVVEPKKEEVGSTPETSVVNGSSVSQKRICEYPTVPVAGPENIGDSVPSEQTVIVSASTTDGGPTGSTDAESSDLTDSHT